MTTNDTASLTAATDENAIVWTTITGQEMRMKDINDTHLRNIINMVRREGRKLRDQINTALDQMDGHETGGFVQEDAQQRLDRKREQVALFVEEAKKRGIDLRIKKEPKT